MAVLLPVASLTANQVDAEIGQLEVELAGSPEEFDKYGRMIELCLRANVKPRALTCVGLGSNLLKTRQLTLENKFEFACSLLSFWKYERFSKKDTIRVNLTPERKEYLLQAQEILQSLVICPDISTRYKILLKLAYIKECLGQLSQALSILSDLITAEADDGVELAYIIFKAATILKRLGQNSQSLEYLEYLQDDPPRTEGITRTHVLALLTLTFEQSGSKYLVAVHETYQKLKESYLSDLRAGPNPEITVSKATRNFETKNIEISSEIWEILSLQMLEKCEIAFALEVFKQATIKAPNKAPLQHSLAELYVLQNEKEKAIPHAEKAYQILPQNGDLRNLLLIIAPSKWNDSLRTAPPVASATVLNQDEEDRILNANAGNKSRIKKKEERTGGTEEEDEWLFHRKPVKKETEEKKEQKSAETQSIVKKKEKKTTKKGTKKEKKAKDSQPKEQEEKVAEPKERKPKFIAPLYNRPMKPSGEMTPEMRKIIAFAVKENKNVHMYDDNLRQLQGVS